MILLSFDPINIQLSMNPRQLKLLFEASKCLIDSDIIIIRKSLNDAGYKYTDFDVKCLIRQFQIEIESISNSVRNPESIDEPETARTTPYKM